jgi:hypothetical protein
VAVTELTAAISGVDHQGTAPLPSAADTLARFEAASARYRRVATAPAVDFDSLLCAQDEVTMCRCQLAAAVTPDVQRAVVRYEIAFATVDRLSRVDARDMSPAQFDSLKGAQKRMDESRALLAAAGQLHLIEVS